MGGEAVLEEDDPITVTVAITAVTTVPLLWLLILLLAVVE